MPCWYSPQGKTQCHGDNMTYTSELASFTSTLSIESIPEDVRRMARVCLLDTIGVILAGHECLERDADTSLPRYLDALAVGDDATAFGYHRRAGVSDAAFINGCLTEVLDWQDSTLPACLHSCSGTIPAVLAVAEKHGFSGSQILTAITAGYEVGTRVGVAIQPSHWYGGFQATGTIGAIGAAAAVGSLLGFEADEMTRNLGVAGHIAPISNGDGVFHGTSSKLLHGGMAAQTGIQSAVLTKSGFGAGPLEGLPPRHHGFMNISSDEMNEQTLIRDLGSEWLTRLCSHKAYPVGLLNIGPVEVTLELVTENNILPDQVEAVDVTSFSSVLHFTGRSYTNTESGFSDCVLSLPYTVAAAIADRTFGPLQLASDRIKDPALHELARKVRVHADTEMDIVAPMDWPVIVDITMNNGRHCTRRRDKVVGCPNRPMTDQELANKFIGNAEVSIGPANAERVLNACMDLDNLSDIADVVGWLTPQG